MTSHNNTTIGNGFESRDKPFYTVAEQVLIYFAGILLSLVTIFGNILVVVAYKSNKRLQTITNLFILSLAISDITVGIFSINFYVVYIVLKRWPLGTVICNIWLCLDYFLTQASVIHLLLICLDRYFSLSKPIKYRVKRTKHRVAIVISSAWLVAFVQWVPLIVGYPFIVGERTVPVDQCYLQFLDKDKYTTIATSVLGYVVPVMIMGFVYLRVFALVKKRQKSLQNSTKVPTSTKGAPKIVVTDHDENNVSSDSKKASRKIEVKHEKLAIRVSYSPNVNKRKTARSHSKLSAFLRQKRTAKLLSALFLSYAITWLPYYTFHSLSPFCSDCIPALGWDLSYMLCYINSTVNPLMYALGSRDFRHTFKRLLCRRTKNENRNSANVSKNGSFLATPSTASTRSVDNKTFQGDDSLTNSISDIPSTFGD